jgi:antirestriction protein ArdC
MTPQEQERWTELLQQAISEPGRIAAAYSAFHGYSLGNQLLALMEWLARDIEPGPIATYRKWQERGRQVRKGEKAITLCMPRSYKRVEVDDDTGEKVERTWMRFIFKAQWFVMSQTDGDEWEPEPIGDWSPEHALEGLSITRVPFAHLDGNVQGYATQRHEVAVSPVAGNPAKTLLHEMAHVVLRHVDEHDMEDGERLERGLREVEAESVAYLCLDALGLPGAEEARGYIQHWWQSVGGRSDVEIPEGAAHRIISAANVILTAGREAPAGEEA